MYGHEWLDGATMSDGVLDGLGACPRRAWRRFADELPAEGQRVCIYDARLVAIAVRRGDRLEVASPEMSIRIASYPDWTWTEAPEPPAAPQSSKIDRQPPK